MRILRFLIFCSSYPVFAQIPETLVTERSFVIYDSAPEQKGEYLVRGDWLKRTEKIQSLLRLTGVDVVSYLHQDDWNASPSHKDAYRLFFLTREIRNIITISEEENLVRMKIQDAESMKELWVNTGSSIDQLIYRLGKEIKALDYEVQNFLLLEKAEIFTDIPVTKWNTYKNFPRKIRGSKVGVAKFGTDTENDTLIKIMAQHYPYKFEIIDYSSDEDALRQGYQYVLSHISTTGESIKRLLNYQEGINETAYVSSVAGEGSSFKIKTIPSDANVIKFYFRHTVSQEIFVGYSWDADVTWDQALKNFLVNLRKVLVK